jgi:type I restriction enzyme S subunit
VKTVRVGDISRQIRGVSYEKGEASLSPSDGLVPILRANNISDGEINLEDLVYVPSRRVKAEQYLIAGDVLIAASSGSLDVVGKAAPARVDLNAGFGAFCKVLRPNNQVWPPYFSHFFQTPRYRKIISTLAAGANINNLKNEHLDNLEIPLPPLPEQRRLAAILDAADALRAKRRAALGKLEVLLQAVFLEMFGEVVGNERGWEVWRLGDITSVATGSTPSRDHPEYYGGGIPWVKTTEVNWETILRTTETVTQKGRNRARLRLFPRGSIVIAMYGQGTTRGKSAILGIDATVNQACAVISPSSRFSTEYLSVLLKMQYEEIRKLGRGGNQPNLNLSLVQSLPILMPPLALQHQFASIVNKTSDLRRQFLNDLEKKKGLFQSLQQRAFRGEL